MAPVISIRTIAEELDGLMSEATAYLNRRTGEVFTLTEQDKELVTRADDGGELVDWERQGLPQIRDVLEGDDWLVLPSRHDIHEWSIMRDFCHSITDVELQERLLNTLHGSGAFRHFKDMVYRHGIEEQWYRFKANALEQIVVDWLEQNDIAYTPDDRPPSSE